MDGSVEKERVMSCWILEKPRGDEWIEFWRKERTTSQLEYRDGKWRCVERSVEKGKGDEWI